MRNSFKIAPLDWADKRASEIVLKDYHIDDDVDISYYYTNPTVNIEDIAQAIQEGIEKGFQQGIKRAAGIAECHKKLMPQHFEAAENIQFRIEQLQMETER